MVKLSTPFRLALFCSAVNRFCYGWGSGCFPFGNMTYPSFSNFTSETNSSFYGQPFLNAAATQLVEAAISTGTAINMEKCEWILGSEVPYNGTIVIESNSSLGIQIMRFCTAMNSTDCTVVAALHGKQCSSASFSCQPYKKYTDSSTLCWNADCSNLSPNYPHCVLEAGTPMCPKSWAVSMPNTATSWMVAGWMLLQLASKI